MRCSIKNIVLPDAPEPTRPIRNDRFEGYGKMIYERQIPTTAMELMIPPTRSNSKAAEAEREIKVILDLAREGKTASEICKATGFNHNRVVQVVKRFAEHGAKLAPEPKKPVKSSRTYKTAYKHPRQEWTDDKIQQVIDMYKSGVSFLEISEKMGCSEKMAYMVIYRARKDGKVDKIRNKLGWSTEQDETLIRMYNEGAVYVDISQAIGKSVSAVSMRIQKLHDAGKINHRKDRRCKR